MNKTKISTLWSKAVVLILTFALLVGSICFYLSMPVYANSTSFNDFPLTDMNLENGQFANSSGSAPKVPSNWTGSNLSGGDIGDTRTGVVSLPTEYDEKVEKKLRLNDYPEYKNADPQTPFGTSTSIPGTNKSVLIINTLFDTSYGYSSANLTFAPNKFYMVSAYIKTGDFKDNSGASLRINGMDKDISINNINTVRNMKRDADGLPILTKDNDYGFTKYTIFVATPSMKTSTVSVVLSVGDRYAPSSKDESNYYLPAQGYAMFDNITAYEISPTKFYSVKEGNETNLVKDYSAVMTEGNWSFENGKTDWTLAPDAGYGTSNVTSDFYNANTTFATENEYNLKTEPVSSIGKNLAGEGTNNILVISSYKNNEYQDIAYGAKSSEVLIKRMSYTRVSIWVKTQDIGGAGVTLAISSNKNQNPDTMKEEDKLFTTIVGSTGDDSNAARYGWKEHVFFIKGSSVDDYSISVEMWLGRAGSPASGIAMFDNIRIEPVSYTEYTENSSGATTVTFDPTFTDTGITNGEFYEAGDNKEYAFPMAPSGWVKYDTSTVASNGYSQEFKKTDDVISGLMPTDTEHFNANVANYGYGATNPRIGQSGNVLYISSRSETAVCYRSPNFTATASAASKLTISMKVQNVIGYGASLVLKSGDKVVSTIENITDTNNNFRTFEFYIEGGYTDLGSLSVEIWLGLNDRQNNNSKLSAGNVYVESVGYAALAEGETFATYRDKYQQTLTDGFNLTFSVYSFKQEDFTAFDEYDKSYVKRPYNWTLSSNRVNSDVSNVTYGIFNSKSIPSNQVLVPSYFKNDKDAKNHNVLYLFNTSPTSSKITLNNTHTLTANEYYKFSVTLKVDISEKIDKTVGAGIELVGTKYKFENITDTSSKIDTTVNNETFRTFNFFVAVGAEGLDASIAITLGGNKYTSQDAKGRVYVNNIEVTSITNVLYEDTIKKLDDKKDTTIDKNYNIKVPLSTEKTEDETPAEPFQLQWWLIPSILLGVAIIIALVGVSVRKISERRASKKQVEAVNSYDRNATIKNIVTDKEGNVSVVNAEDMTYDEFDDASKTQKVSEKTIEKAPKETVEENLSEVSQSVPEDENASTKDSEPMEDSFDKFDD